MGKWYNKSNRRANPSIQKPEKDKCLNISIRKKKK